MNPFKRYSNAWYVWDMLSIIAPVIVAIVLIMTVLWIGSNALYKWILIAILVNSAIAEG